MCKECEKRAATMRVPPFRIDYPAISYRNIEELCGVFRRSESGIVIFHFVKENITVTIGLESEIEMLEKVLETPYLPLFCEQCQKILVEFTK